MTQEQLARKLKISRQGVGKIEEREVNDSISIGTLKEVGKAMDLKLVYTMVHNQGSFEQLIEKKANRLVRNIVLRTNHNMALEDQAIDQDRLKESIE